MKIYNVRITIGKYDFFRHVLANDLNQAIQKSIKYGEKKAKTEGRDGRVRVLSVVEIDEEVVR